MRPPSGSPSFWYLRRWRTAREANAALHYSPLILPNRDNLMPFTIAAAAARGEPSSGTGQRLLAHSMRRALASLLVVAAAAGGAQAATKTSHFVLANGMEVVVVPN